MEDPAVPVGDELGRRIAEFLADREPGVAGVEVTLGERTSLGLSMENRLVDVAWTRGGRREKRALILRREGAANFTNGTRAGEFDVLRALDGTAVATPAALWLDADGAAFGRPTMFLERVDGAADPDALTEAGSLGADLDQRQALAERLFDQLIALHQVDIGRIELGRTERRVDPDPARAEIESWWQLAEQNMLEPLPELTEVRHWLLEHLRPSDSQVIVHGDFRPENALVRDGEVVAVLDWELARIGDPLFDLGWYLLPMFVHQHTIPGTWEAHHVLERYQERTGLPVTPEDMMPWSVLAMLQIVAMLACNQRAFVEGRLNQGFTWWRQQQLLHLVFTMMGI